MVARRLSRNGRRRTTGRPKADAARVRPSPESLDDPLRSLTDSVADLRDQIKGLAQVKIDQVDLAVRSRASKIPFYGVLGVMALSFVAAAAGFLLYAAALGMTRLCGNQPWLGFLLTGGFVLAVFLTAAYVLHIRSRRRHRERLEKKYDSTHA